MHGQYNHSSQALVSQPDQLFEELKGGKSEYKDEVLLVVNTASKCGFTPQFDDLEKLHQKYKDQGLKIIGFPCNQFLFQDPGSNDDILSFCQMNYGVTFDMFGKIKVKGKEMHELYKFLLENTPVDTNKSEMEF